MHINTFFLCSVIGADEIQKKKSVLKKAGSAKPLLDLESRSTNSSVDSADDSDGSYTGGEGAGECTGDSGFADAKTFLKVKVGSSQPTAPSPGPRLAGAEPASGGGHYTTLGTPDSVEGYTTVTRGNSSADQAGGRGSRVCS